MLLPAWTSKTLLALGVASALALPALSASFGARLADGLGVEILPGEAKEQRLTNLTRVSLSLEAIRPERDVELTFEGGNATLATPRGAIPVESATARASCEAPECFRTVVFTFVFPPESGLPSEWTLDLTVTWESEDLGVRASQSRSFRGEGLSYA